MTSAEMQRIQQELEEARIEDPDLSAVYDMHARLFKLLAQASDDILPSEFGVKDETALQASLLQGIPLLSFAALPLEEDRFAALVSDVASLLVESNPEFKGQRVPDSPDECLNLARQQFEEGQVIDRDASAEEGEAEPSLAQMAVDLALKPYLEWEAARMLPHVDLEFWKRGYCPACGSSPGFAFLGAESGARYLICSRCSSQWPYHRVSCPFCGTREHTKLSYYLSEDQVYRLYVCQACRRYLKALDLRAAGREVLLPVERVRTVGMDLAARQEGYR